MALVPLEPEGPRVAASWFEAIFGEDAGTPGIGASNSHLFVVDVEGDDFTIRDVDGVAAVFEIGHEAGIGASREEVFTEGDGGEALAAFIGDGGNGDR